MSISSRIHDTIEGWVVEWRDRLRGWIASAAETGIEKVFDLFEVDLRSEVKPSMERLKTIPGLPDDIKSLLDRATDEPKAVQFLAIVPYLIALLVGLAMGSVSPVAKWGSYQTEKFMKSLRLDPSTVINLWRRDKTQYEPFFEDLKDQGWNDDRLDALRELAKILPPLPDMVRFADFSSFDPEVIDAWREFYDAPGWISEPMSLLGITNEAPRDWANKYWFSHWIQPGRYELGEMYRRGLLGSPLLGQTEVGGGSEEGEAEATIKLAYKTMGYSSFWQDRLLQLVREIPTRVDVRRWWDMRTIDETELRSLYQRHGYFGKDLDNYVIWTKVYVAFPDLIARWTKGWITEDDVRAELVALGMPADRVETMIQTKIKPTEQEPISEAKKVTQTAIIKWVKEDPLARWEQGVDLLMDLGYDEAGARFVLDAYIAEMGSPETYEDWQKITSEYRKATGRTVAPVPEELKAAAAELVRIKLDVEALERDVKEESGKLTAEEEVPDSASKKLKKLQVTLNRARAELQRIQLDYNSLVARWKHAER